MCMKNNRRAPGERTGGADVFLKLQNVRFQTRKSGKLEPWLIFKDTLQLSQMINSKELLRFRSIHLYTFHSRTRTLDYQTICLCACPIYLSDSVLQPIYLYGSSAL